MDMSNQPQPGDQLILTPYEGVNILLRALQEIVSMVETIHATPDAMNDPIWQCATAALKQWQALEPESRLPGCVLIINHDHGRDVFLGDEKTLYDRLYRYVKDWWGEELGDTPMPEDPAQAIEVYFEKKERTESYDLIKVPVWNCDPNESQNLSSGGN